MSHSNCIKLLNLTRTVIYLWIGAVCFLWAILIIVVISNTSFDVYETEFSFDGKYKINTHHNDDTVFTTKCHATTSYDDCYYKIYTSSDYSSAEDYGEIYCNNSTLHGFITLDENKCTLHNPNSKLYTAIMVYLGMLAYFMIETLNIYLFPNCFDENIGNNLDDDNNHNNNNINNYTNNRTSNHASNYTININNNANYETDIENVYNFDDSCS